MSGTSTRRFVASINVLFTSLSSAGCAEKSESQANQQAGPVATLDFSFEGIEFEPHNGQEIVLAIIDKDENRRILLTQAIVNEGKFSIKRPQILVDGHRYSIDYFADMNGNKLCDPPQTDHVWRINVAPVRSALALIDTHKMNFHDSCASFNETFSGITGDRNIAVTGRLLLGEGVAAPDLSPEQPLVGAWVTLEGYPDQDTVTDANGNFTLSLSLPSSTAGLTSVGRLVMWYTQPKPNKTSTDWDIAQARFGAMREIDLAANVTVGDQQLGHTKGVKLPIVDGDTEAPVGSGCWVRSPSLGPNLIVVPEADGIYHIDYLPPGSYAIAISCKGYHDQTVTVDVDQASESGTFTTAPRVALYPHS